MSAGSVLEILEMYFEAFAETDAARRADLLGRCIADKGEIRGPNLRFSGREEIAAKIADATLPPVPASWPRPLAVPPLQDDRVAGSQRTDP